jgi:NADH-quinone oxidoreductase subunit N
MIVFLLSLGGIPPTAGFIGKYFLFAAAVQAGFGWLAIVAVLMSAVSMYYYLRIVVAMYLSDGVEGETAATPSLNFVAVVAFVMTLVIGLAPELFVRQVRSSSHIIAPKVARR